MFLDEQRFTQSRPIAQIDKSIVPAITPITEAKVDNRSSLVDLCPEVKLVALSLTGNSYPGLGSVGVGIEVVTTSVKVRPRFEARVE